jgi:hypothetical protein
VANSIGAKKLAAEANKALQIRLHCFRQPLNDFRRQLESIGEFAIVASDGIYCTECCDPVIAPHMSTNDPLAALLPEADGKLRITKQNSELIPTLDPQT